MIFRIGIENNNEDRTIAWGLDHPGCFAYGQDSVEAQKNFLMAAREYKAWIAQHEEPWLDEVVEVSLEETFDAYFITPAFERGERGRGTYMVESFFLYDWKPLLPHEIERALKMLAWSRADLMSVVGARACAHASRESSPSLRPSSDLEGRSSIAYSAPATVPR